MKNKILIVLLSLFILSCSAINENTKTVRVASTLISKGSLYGGGEEGIAKQNLVISDQITWKSLMSQMDLINNVSDDFKETDIDFSKYRIIAVFDDVKGSGGHSLELDISNNSSNILVEITDVAPDGIATTVITQPFHIVKITNSDLPIVFE